MHELGLSQRLLYELDSDVEVHLYAVRISPKRMSLRVRRFLGLEPQLNSGCESAMFNRTSAPST